MQYKNELLLNKTEKNCWENYMISMRKTAKYYKKSKGVITEKETNKYKNMSKKDIRANTEYQKKEDTGKIKVWTNF